MGLQQVPGIPQQVPEGGVMNPEMTMVERLLSYYGFPIVFSLALLVMVWKGAGWIATTFLEPLIKSLTTYFDGLPEVHKRSIDLLEQTKQVTQRIETKLDMIHSGKGKNND